MSQTSFLFQEWLWEFVESKSPNANSIYKRSDSAIEIEPLLSQLEAEQLRVC